MELVVLVQQEPSVVMAAPVALATPLPRQLGAMVATAVMPATPSVAEPLAALAVMAAMVLPTAIAAVMVDPVVPLARVQPVPRFSVVQAVTPALVMRPRIRLAELMANPAVMAVLVGAIPAQQLAVRAVPVLTAIHRSL